MTKRVLSLLLALTLSLGLFPAWALAAETELPEEEAAPLEEVLPVEDETPVEDVLSVEDIPAIEDSAPVEDAPTDAALMDGMDTVYTDEDGNTYVMDESAFSEMDSPALLEAAEGEDSLTPLANPTDLRWEEDDPGIFSYTIRGLFQNQVQVKVYRKGTPDQLAWMTTMRYGSIDGIPSEGERSFSSDIFCADLNASHDINSHHPIGRLGSGEYYFTIQNLGDGIRYTNSEEVSSLEVDGGIFHYEEPEARLEIPDQGQWKWPAACWNGPSWGEDSRYRGYYIDYGYSEQNAENSAEIKRIGSSLPWWSDKEDKWLQEKLIGNNGVGWYYFRIRALSSDVTKWRNGEFSPWSEGYNLQEASEKITEALNNINSETPSDIRQQVQALNRTELENALVADIPGAGNGSLDALAALEERLGGPAQPQVAEELKEVFDKNEVSIVGATLNDVVEGSPQPVLNIGRAKQDNHVRSELYDSTLAVDFSMDLEHIQQTHELKVPVKVTLPIPANINPKFLVILHYPMYGSYTEVLHNVFEKDGKWYVSFVLTSFSDFILTVKCPSIAIQSDGSYEVKNSDQEGAQLYLARYDGWRFESLEELKDFSGTLSGAGKLFLMDRESCRPLCAAAILDVREPHT